VFDLPPYVDRCALIRLETLAERRANACFMLIFDILTGGVHEPLNGASRSFNEFAGLFDLHLSRYQFFYRLWSVL
jgi:hypothetical protein